MIKNLLNLCIFLSVLSSFSQIKRWYQANPEFTDRLLISKDSIISERYKTYNVETPYWEKNKTLKIKSSQIKNNKNYMLFSLPDNKTAGGIFTLIEKDFMLAHVPKEMYTSLSELEHLPGNSIPHKLYLSENLIENITNYKSLEYLTKEHLIKAIKFVQSYNNEFEKMLEANPKLRQFSLFRMAENLYHFKLYQLGYNPFNLPDEGNYLDKFKNDNELKSLFEGKQFFQLRL